MATNSLNKVELETESQSIDEPAPLSQKEVRQIFTDALDQASGSDPETGRAILAKMKSVLERDAGVSLDCLDEVLGE